MPNSIKSTRCPNSVFWLALVVGASTWALSGSNPNETGNQIRLSGLFGWPKMGPGIVHERTFSVAQETFSEAALRIRHTHGDISIHGWDQPGLELQGKIRVRSKNAEISKTIAEDTGVALKETRDGWALETVRPKTRRSWKQRENSVAYELWVPTALLLTIDTEHSNVLLESMTGAQSVNGQHGNLELRSIGGRAEVRHEHGKVTLDTIGSAAAVTKRHGDLSIRDIQGFLDLNQEHGAATVTQVLGEVTVVKRHGPLNLSQVGGSVALDQEHSTADIQSVEGGLHSRRRHGRLKAHDIQGEIHIDSEHGGVNLTYSRPIVAPVTIQSEHGPVRLRVPNLDSVGMDIDLEHGGLKANRTWPYLSQQGFRTHAEASGSPMVRVSNRHGSVTLEP